MNGATHPAAEVLVDRGVLRTRIGELATELMSGLDTPDPPIAIAILKGSALFLADLIRATDIDVEVDFMAITSYAASGKHSGVVRIVKDLDTDITGRDVIIVEDIVDTGLTLTYLRRTLGERGPRSLQAVTLLDKAARRIIPVELEHRGFEIPDVFVVGYGLDFQGRYRNVPDILQVNDLARLANDPLLLGDQVFTPG
jgi:hypoxanthine phosphoribosyltransferase